MKNLNNKKLRGVIGCLSLCSMLITGCNNHDVCIKCNAAFVNEKHIKQIKHIDSESSLKEKSTFFYKESLIDSIIKVEYKFPLGDSITTYLKIYYPIGGCILSSYIEKAYQFNNLVTINRVNMSVDGEHILNKHIAFYTFEDELLRGIDVDYTYNGTQVAARRGTDYGLPLGYKYGNEKFFTYTGNNITKVVTKLEQGNYDLYNTFDGNNNPLNIQGGILYYLPLTAYDLPLLAAYRGDQYFATLPLSRNNPITVMQQGKDASNSSGSATFTFTYVYNSAHYPTKVSLKEESRDEMYGNHTYNLGTYEFSYY